MKLKKFLLGSLLAISGFASVYAIIKPNIDGLTTTTSITSDYKLMVQSGTTQRAITAGNFLSGYITGDLSSYIQRDSVDTGFNNTGSDTIIPSEKTVWGLVDGLTNNYIPYWSGDRMYNSNMVYDGNMFVYEGSVNNHALLFLSNTGTNGVGLVSRGYNIGMYGLLHTGAPSGGYGIVGKSYSADGVSIYADSTSTGGTALLAKTNTYTGTAIETQGAILLGGGTTQRKIILSGDNLSVQAFTGGNRVEKSTFTP